MKKIPTWLPYLLLCGIFFIHFPFLHADPDINLSSSRDAFSDEGLNTSQLRNYINHGDLDMMECDNLVKTPLFDLLLYLPLKLFGTHLPVARLTVLVILFASLFYVCTENYFRNILIPLSFTTLIQYFVFQYSHFSLSEMICAAFIFLSIYFLFRFYMVEEKKTKHLLLSVLFSALAYYTKIQFLYIAIFVPATIILIHFFDRKTMMLNWNSHRKSVLWSTGFVLLFAIIYLFCWYLPFNHPFNYVMQNEATDKYSSLMEIPKVILSNIKNNLFNEQGWMFNSCFFICLIIGIMLWTKSNHREYKILFAITFIWVLLESHKLTMVYLPSRYLVSYYFAAGLLSSTVIAELIFFSSSAIKFPFSLSGLRLGWLLLILLTTKNFYDDVNLYLHREYNIQQINEYFSSSLKNKNDIVMGPWAPTMNWESDAITKPVWRDFMNDKNIFSAFHPSVIISEPNEDESNQAYSSQGIHLADHADSVREFTIGKWEVNVYWIGKKSY